MHQGINGAILQAPSALTSNVINPVLGASLAGVLSLDDTTNVTIVGLTIDGNTEGNGSENEVGIAAVNSTGTVINAVTVENVRAPDALFGLQQGYGVFAANDVAHVGTFQIENTTVENFQKAGILTEGAGLTATIDSNTVTGVGPTPLIAQNGIEMIYGATGKINGNTVSGIDYIIPSSRRRDSSGIPKSARL